MRGSRRLLSPFWRGRTPRQTPDPPSPPVRTATPPGRSGRSLPDLWTLSLGISTVWMPYRLAAMVFSFRPPMGSTRPRRVISPVMAIPALILRSGQSRQQRCSHGNTGGWAVLGHRSLREMDMDVLGLIKIRIDPQRFRPAPQAGQSSLGGFLHHVAQITGQLQLAGAFHHVDLDFQDLAAGLRPRKAVHHADLLLRPHGPSADRAAYPAASAGLFL